MHHRDAGVLRCTNASEALHPVVDENVAFVRAEWIDATQNIHERRFAGAVLADERVHFSGMQIERNAV